MSERFTIIPGVPKEVQLKYSRLREDLRALLQGGLVVAFSGGVDSAFLLFAAESVRREEGGKLLALTAVSDSMAQAERRDAREFTEWLKVEHLWEDSQELENPEYAANSGNRCYHCKSELFRIAGEVSRARGLRWIAYGYNASDLGDVRPGHRAAQENGILSPLSEAGLSKDEIRILMRANQLNLAEKPASPCLSSRLMTGVRVTPEKLKDVEYFETLLRDAGLRIFRVRIHEQDQTKFVRLEVDPAEMPKAFELRNHLLNECRGRGYKWLTLDLAGYQTGGGVISPNE